MRPLILHYPEVRRLLAHGDVLVVRPIKVPPVLRGARGDDCVISIRGVVHSGPTAYMLERLAEFGCPLGAVGEQRWVKETWVTCDHTPTGSVYCNECDEASREDPLGGSYRFRSPVRMPQSLSRATVRVEDVRVMRVQELTAEDFRAAGHPVDPSRSSYQVVHDDAARDWFLDQWLYRFGRLHPLIDNPWCWAATCRRATP